MSILTIHFLSFDILKQDRSSFVYPFRSFVQNEYLVSLVTLQSKDAFEDLSRDSHLIKSGCFK